ncbi:MAG: FUSC family protein [Thalassospira sp.]|uniref:FUSC family protein n=1 Tax=Thalassospira sp. TaxID=1912094 RepID=UPI0032EEA806
MLKSILALRPSSSDWIFSVKTFGASIIALYIALMFDLDRPVWAMATVYIVAHPLSGVLASKAAYRVIGTVFGAIAAVVLVPNLVNAPVLLSAALALWVGGCLFLSRLDRTPRSYVFMLAGYTAAIVGFPCVADPGNVFATAIARCQEISLGIVCATLVSHIVLPRHIGPVIAARVDGWMADIGTLARQSFDPDSDSDAIQNDRARIAADLGELHGLALHLGYEKSVFSGRTRQLQALQSAMAALLPVFYAIHDRLVALKAERGQLPDGLVMLLARISDFVLAREHDPKQTHGLHQEISAYADAISGQQSWADLLELNLCDRLHRLLDFHEDCHALWSGIRAGNVPDDVINRWRESGGGRALDRDYGVALRCGLTAVIATLVVCGFWIMSGWPNGATAAMMAAVGASIMSFLDNPVPALKGFIRYTAMAVGVVLFYSLVILPGIDGFPLLAMAFAPYFILLGVLITSPQTYGFGLAMLVNVVMILNVDTAFNSNVAALIGGGIASLAGFGVAAIVTAFIRVVPVDSHIRRLVRANWRDIAAIGKGKLNLGRMIMIRRLLDRQGLILPRLAMAPAHRETFLRVMPEVSIASALYDLRRLWVMAEPEIAVRLEKLLSNISCHFEARLDDFNRVPDAVILSDVDGILCDVLAMSGGARREKILIPLVALRRTLSKDDAPKLGATTKRNEIRNGQDGTPIALIGETA